MKIQKLRETLQRDYYGKARYYTNDDGIITLISYDTEVLRIDPVNLTIERLWNGYSRTTMNHINDFLLQHNYNTLNKKEWLELPCTNNTPVYNIYISNGFCTHKNNALLTSSEAEKTITKNKNPRLICWYE